jgi:hypothetical protein
VRGSKKEEIKKERKKEKLTKLPYPPTKGAGISRKTQSTINKKDLLKKKKEARVGKKCNF